MDIPVSERNIFSKKTKPVCHRMSLRRAVQKIKPGRYRHYKGKFYKVIGVARHSETLEEFVLYQALYPNRFGRGAFWVRPVKMFCGKVRVDGVWQPRFRYVAGKKDWET